VDSLKTFFLFILFKIIYQIKAVMQISIFNLEKKLL
jgi:hypothetical protein